MNLAPWQLEIWSKLAERRTQGRLPHALLLCGPWDWQARFADAFAGALLCQNLRATARPAANAVHVCWYTRQAIRTGARNLGLRDDGKPRTEIIVDQIRGLSERLALTPQFGGHQIALIDPADAMNISASNALLKTLEEPTPATLIMLVADQPSRLPATIRSRCQRIEFRVPALAQASEWLTRQGVDAKSAAAALDAGGGNPGLALSWVQSGGLAMREEVAMDLRGLWSGKASMVEVANRWSKADPEPRLWFAAMLMQVEAQSHARGMSGPLAVATGNVPDFPAWFDRANLARVQLRGPLRPELVVLEALSAITGR